MSKSEGVGEIERRVEQARIRLLFQNLRYGEWLEWVGATAIAVLLWQEHSHEKVAYWWLFMFVAGLILLHIRRKFSDALMQVERVRHAGVVMSWALMLNGIGYGFAMWLFWIEADVLNNVLLSAICAIAFMSYSHPLMPFLPAYILPAMSVSLGLLARLLYEYELLYLSLAGAYLSLAYLFVQGVSNSYKLLSDSILYRYRLEKANEDVEQASKAKNAFFANMSHEIRTPMNGVIGVAQVLADTQLTEEQKKYVGLIDKSGRTLLSLIDEILDISKIESGRLVLHETTFNPRLFAAEIAEMYSLLAAQKGIGFVLELSNEIPGCLVGDEKRLRQIVVNLLGNALKFCDEGEIKLGMGLDYAKKNRCGIRVTVGDSGRGMPKEKLSRIFDRFERIDESRIGGTGLGLAICKLLIEEMNGSIHVESWSGVGSRFTVLLELSVGHCLQEVEKKSEHGSVTGLSILVVDDDEINQLVVTRLLSAMNHSSVSVYTGKEAIERLKQESFDLVLMDIHMPDVGGVEATRWIRHANIDGIKAMPVVGMTASIMSDERDMYLSAGMNRVLGKPINRDELDDAIKNFSTDTEIEMA